MKQAIKDKNIGQIKKTMVELTKASHKFAEEIYKQGAQKQRASAAEGQKAGEQPKEDIVDAEYEEEGRDKT